MAKANAFLQSSLGEFDSSECRGPTLDSFYSYFEPLHPELDSVVPVKKQLFFAQSTNLHSDFDAGVSIDFHSLFGQDSTDSFTSADAYQMILENQWNTDRLQTLMDLTSSNWSSLHLTTLPSGRERLTRVPSESQTNFVSEILTSFTRATCATPSESLSSWLRMQIQWIVWTLASYERRSPRYFGKLLTFENLLICLHHRHSMYTNSALHRPQPLLSRPRRSKFHGQIMMSPLQRCSEIRTFLSPLVVCVSLPTSSDGRVNMQISDGWWWVSVLPDPLIQTKLLDTVSSPEGCDSWRPSLTSAFLLLRAC
jgi:hypothetical protein